MSALKAAIEAAKITIRKYDPTKIRPVYTDKSSVTIGKFVDEVVAALGSGILQHPEIAKCIRNNSEMEKLLEEYVEQEGLDDGNGGGVTVAPEVAHLVLNIDMSSTDPGLKKFFCTTQDEFIEKSISGQYYLGKSGISPSDAFHIARPVVPRYSPRRSRGLTKETNKVTKITSDYFNTYVPAAWALWRERNPNAWAKLPEKLPRDVLVLLKHLVPGKKDREYVYAWMYRSIMRRAEVYLVMSGKPGSGKKETLGANDSKFNTQMLNNTLLWFDELKYGPDMEPRMKEYQNPTIGIEAKGVDSTSSTEIFSSMVITNNYARHNYILFNSRKFAPVELNQLDLKTAMTDTELDNYRAWVDESSPGFDVRKVAQVAKWLIKFGPKYESQFRALEYKGHYFWKLSYDCMPKTNKLILKYLTDFSGGRPPSGWDPTKKAFLWSKVAEALSRKKGFNDEDYRDPQTVLDFLGEVRGRTGEIIFEFEIISSGVFVDFWVKPVGDIGVDLKLKKSDEEDHGPERPPGVSQYQWRKMKAEWEAVNGKGLKDVIEEKEADLL